MTGSPADGLVAVYVISSAVAVTLVAAVGFMVCIALKKRKQIRTTLRNMR